MKNCDILPDATPGLIEFRPIPKFSYSKTLADELGARLTPKQALTMLERMMINRFFEEMVITLKDGKFQGAPGLRFVGATHVSIGQEAVAVGAISAIRPDDYITSTHRGHGHSLAKGACALDAMDLKRIKTFGAQDRQSAFQLHLCRTMAELLGREKGYCRGRGGGMHIADFEAAHLGANAIVGGSLGIATGAGLSCQRLQNGRVALCLIGDGATNNGIFHESLNMAAMSQFKPGLPVIYLIENNQYGMTGQQVGEVTGVDYLARRGAGYNLANCHAEVVDGMNVLAVWDAVGRAAELCRKGQGPVLLECLTYRFYGHSLSDQRTSYRSKQEEECWEARDAVRRFRQQMLEAGAATEEELRALEERCRQAINRATEEAAACPEPDPATLYEGLYAHTSSERIPDSVRTTSLEGEPTRAKRDSQGRILFRHAVAEALTEEMLRDSRVVLYGEDVADYGGAFQVTSGLFEIFGRDRVFNTAISEAAIIGSGTGAAMTGLRPVVEIMYIDFILLAMDQLGNQAAKARYMFGGKAAIPLVIRTTVGGGKGYAGQHSQSLEAVCTMFPGLKVVAPSTPYDAKGLLKAAIRDDNPVVFIEHQLLYVDRGPVPEEDYTVPLGVAAVRRQGEDATVVAYSKMASLALEAAELAEQDGISTEVIDLRTLIPLDLETVVESVSRTGRLVLVTQAPLTGSFPEHVAYQVQARVWDRLKAPIRIVAAHEVPPPMAQSLEREYLPSAQKILAAVKQVCQQAGQLGEAVPC